MKRRVAIKVARRFHLARFHYMRRTVERAARRLGLDFILVSGGQAGMED